MTKVFWLANLNDINDSLKWHSIYINDGETAMTSINFLYIYFVSHE